MTDPELSIVDEVDDVDDDEHDESGLERHDDGSATLTLRQPIRSSKGAVVEELTLPADVKVKHLEQFDKGGGDIAKAIYFLAAVVGQDASLVRAMASRDFNLAQHFIAEKMGKFRETGGKS